MLNRKIYTIFFVFSLWAALFIYGCGDDSTSSATEQNGNAFIYDTVYVNDSVFNIDTLKILDTLYRIDTVFVDSIIGVLVLNHDTIYLKDSAVIADTAKMKSVLSFKELKYCFDEWEGNRVYTVTSGYTYVCKDEQWVLDRTEPYALTNGTITGVAQKGPFMFHSVINLTELYGDSLSKTTRSYTDEVSGNKGDFVIPAVTLENGIVSMEASGRYYNEVTGTWTTTYMTLQSLVEISAGDQKKVGRTKANINILTHLEYDRVLKLYRMGYSLAAAKKQAQQEIMNAFGFPTKITNAEDLDLFSTANNNGVLMTISLLFLRDLSDSLTAEEISHFRQDIAEDGLWQDSAQKIAMADWAYSFDKNIVRASVSSWNIAEIAYFDNSMNDFWQNAYGIGKCTSTRNAEVMKNQNPNSSNKDRYFICRYGSAWDSATTYEKDTYGWKNDEMGAVKKGSATDSFYVYNGTWSYDPLQTLFQKCDSTKIGMILLDTLSNLYKICRESGIDDATALEYNTYQWEAGTPGEIKTGSVNPDYYYYYVADSAWREAKTVEVDTYQWEDGVDGDVKIGSVNTRNCYIYSVDSWQATATTMCDTYGWADGTEGEFKAGNINTTIIYVWDSDESAWREAKDEFEKNYGACTTNREGEEIPVKACTMSCTEKEWSRATFTDSRDGQKYTYVTIGTQTWMAENLNFVPTVESGQSWCYAGSSPVQSTSPCSERGRYYRWNAALNKTRSSCGYGASCSYSTPIQGSCPAGWHIPTRAEWNTLISFVQTEYSNAVYALRATTTWTTSDNATDDYGFDLKAYGSNPYSNGSFSNVGARADYWTADQYSSNNGYYIYFSSSSSTTEYADKDDARNIRCVKD
ncbi:major paralogous domain-containing protein [Fibrobacter sp. UWH9]|uniref:FISUMP domain-containing protein n=1 Tax=Fibrobacter sp. UWH9 TaxID=1896213 RepID=UPI00091B1ACD|nr:FISUMP domain-containing protein [Fibrobacter sp. UWH9]SHH78092.1 major paralogous domain-containing protein [Fibrobacter sp. UWH9]